MGWINAYGQKRTLPMRQPGSTLCLRLWPSWRSALLPAGDLEMLRRGVLGLVHLSQYTVPCSERSVLGCLPATFLDEMRKKNLLEVQHLSICFWEVGLLELFLTPSLWLQRRIVFSRVRVWVESLAFWRSFMADWNSICSVAASRSSFVYGIEL